MISKHLYVLLFFSLMVSSYASAGNTESKTGIGFSAGISNYIGDLDDNFVPRFSTPGVGLHLIHSFSPVISFRVAYYRGWLKASDAEGVINNMQARNLSFKTNIDELSGLLRLKLASIKLRRSKFALIEPYIFGGVGFFHFNPKSKYNDTWYELHPLGTEGQYLSYGNNPDPYSLYQWAIPFGAGVEKSLNSHWVIGVEIGLRKLFTDYLDDVSWNYPDQIQIALEMGPVAAALSDPSNRSQYPEGRSRYLRGNPERKDWYSYSNFHITYYFSSAKRKYGRRNLLANYNRCPK
ncbi:MAG: DUF6089 family protein [Bacteroidota bacterium]